MKRTLALIVLALPLMAGAQVANTTPGILEQSGWSFSSDNRQFVLTDIGVYEVTLDIPFLPRLSAGHGFVFGTATQRELSLEVFGWELYGRLPIGGDGLFVKGSWGPIVDAIQGNSGIDRYRVTFPLRLTAGYRF